jgi:hypothetical protein
MPKLSELVKELRAIELEHADDLETTMEALPGRLASALVEGIMLDSRKHAAFCDAILEIEAEQVPDDMQVGRRDAPHDGWPHQHRGADDQEVQSHPARSKG